MKNKIIIVLCILGLLLISGCKPNLAKCYEMREMLTQSRETLKEIKEDFIYDNLSNIINMKELEYRLFFLTNS